MDFWFYKWKLTTNETRRDGLIPPDIGALSSDTKCYMHGSWVDNIDGRWWRWRSDEKTVKMAG